MWTIVIRSPSGEPRIFPLHPGNNTIGRMSGNDIVILDPSASRFHAQIIFEPDVSSITVQDLGSTNGTFVNHARLSGVRTLKPSDVIRIGQHLLELSFQQDTPPEGLGNKLAKTQMLTRDLVLESLDQHAVLLSEVASRLNTILDLPTALQTVSNMMKVAMGADRCEVILADQLEQLNELGFARSIAQQAIQQRSAVMFHDAASDPSVGRSAALLNIHAALCVPIINADEILAIIYVFKNRPHSRTFNNRDLQIAIAIGHQASLTIQRMRLIEKIRRQEMLTGVLGRLLPTQEMQHLIEVVQETGQLPELEEHTLTVMTVDIAGSTEIAHRLGPQAFGALLGNYYKLVTKSVFDHNGLVSRTVGDGMMGVFGLPPQQAEAEQRAVYTAQAILDQLEQQNLTEPEKITVGIGINTGPAIAGYLGGDGHYEFTILGYTVNIAWGLQALARPNRILIGDVTCQGIAGEVPVTALGLQEIKKHAAPIEVFEVLR